MRTTPSPRWDWKPLVLVGLAAGLLGPVLAGSGGAGSSVVGFVALVLLLTLVVRRTRRTRPTTASSATPEPVPGHVSGHV